MRRKLGWNLREAVPIAHKQLRAIWRPIRWLLRELTYHRWVMDTHVSSPVSLATGQKAVVIIPSYHKKRTRNLPPLVRFALKCDFVERVIISNHTPEVCLEGRVETRDDRVVVMNQTIRRGCTPS